MNWKQSNEGCDDLCMDHHLCIYMDSGKRKKERKKERREKGKYSTMESFLWEKIKWARDWEKHKVVESS